MNRNRVGADENNDAGRRTTIITGDRRDPVAESELGDAQFCRLPGRTALASLTVDLADRLLP